MSQYKDFTSYNNAAEQVRPTARIQLVQRILNAASVISSLVNGIPMKWASAYKSFQVLKYSENSNPEDVTSSNAVSAVDSILHEAESQLRASNDDMNTLCQEFADLPMSGHLNYVSMTHPSLTDQMYGEIYLGLVNPDSNSVAGVVLYLSVAPKVFYMSNTSWSELRTDKKVFADFQNGMPSKLNMATYNVGGSGYFLRQFWMAMGTSYDQAHAFDRAAIFIQVVTGNSKTTFDVYCGTGKYEYTVNWSDSYYSTPRDMPTTTNFTMSNFWNPGITTQGTASAYDCLGLPNPSNVITILDNM